MAETPTGRSRRRSPARLCEHRDRRSRGRRLVRAHQIQCLYLMPSAWRIVRAAHVNSAFTGEGARVYGGRWNSRGTRVIDVSEHESLAALELFVHLTPLSPDDLYRSFRLEWEDKLTEYFAVKILPRNCTPDPPSF